MLKYGIIGFRNIINPLIDGIVTNPYGNSTHPWLHYEPKTGRPHGESSTICTNLVIKWLRENAQHCEFILYFLPPCGIGGGLYKDRVKTDQDFVEPHFDIREKKKHSSYCANKQKQYLEYVKYLFRNFGNLYFIPYETYLGVGDNILSDLLVKYPSRVIDPHVFDEAEREKLSLIRQYVSYNTGSVKEIIGALRTQMTTKHRNTFHSVLKIEYDPKAKNDLKIPVFGKENCLTCTYSDKGYFQIALRHFISLRTLGGYVGKCFIALAKDNWEDWQLSTLTKLGVEYEINSQERKYSIAIEKIAFTSKALHKRYPDYTGPLIWFDADIWFQRKIDKLIQDCETDICFSTWHGQDLILQRKYLQHEHKYIKILSTTAHRQDQKPGWVEPNGGIPHAGFLGGPMKEILPRLLMMEKQVNEGLVPDERTGDEISLFLTCDPDKDKFHLNKYWIAFPKNIDLVTRVVTDEEGLTKPILHFENNQKTSSLADFFVVYPDVVSRVIEEYDLFELKEYGRLTAWHLRVN